MAYYILDFPIGSDMCRGNIRTIQLYLSASHPQIVAQHWPRYVNTHDAGFLAEGFKSGAPLRFSIQLLWSDD